MPVTIKGGITIGPTATQEDKDRLMKAISEQGTAKGLFGQLMPGLKKKPEVERVVEEPKEEEKEEESEEKLEEEEPEKVEESPSYIKKELFEMVKSEQVAILEKLGAENIPRYEKGRVNLILNLQVSEEE